MGITIHHRLSIQKVNVKRTLDRTANLALNLANAQAPAVAIPFKVRRLSDYQLLIDIGNCETLAFDFKSVKEIKAEAEKGWSYLHATLTEDGKKPLDEGYMIEKYPQNEIYYASGFCKTQFAKSIIEHKWVADLIRSVASYCLTADVSDEGDYYHTGNLEDATEAISSLGVMINGIGNALNAQFGTDNVVKGGDTTIKSRKTKNK